MTTKEKILFELKDINFMYNNCSMYNTIKDMLDEMEEELRIKFEQEMINEILAFNRNKESYIYNLIDKMLGECKNDN